MRRGKLPDALFANGLPAGTTEDLEEERRLLYVAMTRAKDDLHLCVPKTSSVLIWGSNRAACLLVGHQADVPTHLMYVSAFEGGTGSAWSSWALRSGY
jgi:superfamily I DNA/RNA helicase